MEWVGCKVYEPLVHERGFQKSGEERNAELEVLETAEGGELTAWGRTIKNDDDEEHMQKSSSTGELYLCIDNLRNRKGM